MIEGRLRLGIGDNLLDAVLGYAVVFIGLTLLMTVVIIVGKIMVAQMKNKASEKKADVPAPAAAAVPAVPIRIREMPQ